MSLCVRDAEGEFWLSNDIQFTALPRADDESRLFVGVEVIVATISKVTHLCWSLA